MARLRQAQAAGAADKAMVETIKGNARLAELLDEATGSTSQLEINEFWRKLVESNDIVVNMERHGVSRVALREEGNDLAKLHRLLNEGIDPGRIARAVALASAIDKADSARIAASATPQQVAALLERGIAASRAGSSSEHAGRHDWPPIINLSEADGYYFAAGSADLTPDFGLALRTLVVARLLQIAEEFDVDVIEVFGHTDEQPVSNRVSNLDRNLPAVTLGLSEPGPLQWADNAGLGLARALAVVKVLAVDPDFPRSAVLGSAAHRYRWPAYPLGCKRRRARAPADRNPDAQIRLSGHCAEPDRRAPVGFLSCAGAMNLSHRGRSPAYHHQRR